MRMNTDKLMETIHGVEVPDGYAMRSKEAVEIWNASDGEWLHAISYAFCYGFLKGQRAERAAARKQAQEKRRRELETDAPGYGLLTCLIGRNRRNEKFIRVMTAHAKNLEKRTGETEG